MCGSFISRIVQRRKSRHIRLQTIVTATVVFHAPLIFIAQRGFAFINFQASMIMDVIILFITVFFFFVACFDFMAITKLLKLVTSHLKSCFTVCFGEFHCSYGKIASGKLLLFVIVF